MNSLTLPRWFGRSKKKKEKNQKASNENVANVREAKEEHFLARSLPSKPFLQPSSPQDEIWRSASNLRSARSPPFSLPNDEFHRKGRPKSSAAVFSVDDYDSLEQQNGDLRHIYENLQMANLHANEAESEVDGGSTAKISLQLLRQSTSTPKSDSFSSNTEEGIYSRRGLIMATSNPILDFQHDERQGMRKICLDFGYSCTSLQIASIT